MTLTTSDMSSEGMFDPGQTGVLLLPSRAKSSIERLPLIPVTGYGLPNSRPEGPRGAALRRSRQIHKSTIYQGKQVFYAAPDLPHLPHDS
jgi:hypothetical protein